VTRGTLRPLVGRSPIAHEHQRLLRTALRRGELTPEIPETAALVGTFDPDVLDIARGSWRLRMQHEHQSSTVFSRLLPQLIEAEVDLEWKTVALRMAMDELRHAALSADVVRLLGGSPEVEVELSTEPLPEHATASPAGRALRNVLFACCLSESLSAPLLSAERDLSSEPSVKKVLEQLAADETLHARYGWAYLEHHWPQLTPEEQARTNAYLPVALASIEARFVDALPDAPLPPPEIEAQLAALGVTMPARTRALAREVLETVVVVALEEAGLDAVRAWSRRTPPVRAGSSSAAP
jgi:hypothetical protein